MIESPVRVGSSDRRGLDQPRVFQAIARHGPRAGNDKGSEREVISAGDMLSRIPRGESELGTSTAKAWSGRQPCRCGFPCFRGGSRLYFYPAREPRKHATQPSGFGISTGALLGVSTGGRAGVSGGDFVGVSGGDLGGVSGGGLAGVSGGDLEGVSGVISAP
jgi:hypothetical protein